MLQINEYIGLELYENKFSRDEVIRAIKSLPNGKSCGPDLIYAEYFKHDTVIEYILKLFNRCFVTLEYPSYWSQAIIVPIFKSGNRCDPQNYRGIALQCTLLKAFTKVLNDRLNMWIEDNNILVPEQLGFQKDHGCIEHVLSVHMLVESRKLLGKDTFLCFIDFKKAFDSVNRNLLWY